MMTSNLATPQGVPSVGPAAQNVGLILPRAGVGDASSTVEFKHLKRDGFQTNSIPPGLQRLERMNDTSNSLAQSIQVADAAMQEIDTHIDEMKDTLIQHLKLNPPYPPGSEERVNMLKSLSSLRKLIDKLTYPPEDAGAGLIMAAPEKLSQNQQPVVIEAGEHGERISQN